MGNDQYNPKYEKNGYQSALAEWVVPAAVIFGFLFMLNHQRYWRHHEFWGTALFALPIVMLPAIRRALGCFGTGRPAALPPAALRNRCPAPAGRAWHRPGSTAARPHHCGLHCLPLAASKHTPSSPCSLGWLCRSIPQNFYSGVAYRLLNIVLGIVIAAGALGVLAC